MSYSVVDYTKSMLKLSTVLAHRQKNGISNKIYLDRNIQHGTEHNQKDPRPTSPKSLKTDKNTVQKRKRKLKDMTFPYAAKVKYDKEITIYMLGFGTAKLHLLPNDCTISIFVQSHDKV